MGRHNDARQYGFVVEAQGRQWLIEWLNGEDDVLTLIPGTFTVVQPPYKIAVLINNTAVQDFP
jgi:hypothetical protein